MSSDDPPAAIVNPPDPSRCPLCGEPNACGVARGLSTCWCFSASVPEEVLERVPRPARGLACVCERCAAAKGGGTDVQAPPEPAGSGPADDPG